MENGTKKQIRQADLANYEWVNGNPNETDNAKTDVAKVRQSGAAFEPEQSNYNQYGTPAEIRATE